MKPYTLFAITDNKGNEVFYSATQVHPQKRFCDLVNGSLNETSRQADTVLAEWIRNEYEHMRHVTYKVIGEFATREEMILVRHHCILNNPTCLNTGRGAVKKVKK